MKYLLIGASAIVLCAIPASGRQTTSYSRSATAQAEAALARADARLAAFADADDMLDDDPAYARYKEGYNAILEERWTDAKKRLEGVIADFPKSEYRDDAEYWHAYALMHIDRKQAIEAYEKFTKDFPKSNYYDDAVADLEKLNSGVYVISSGSSPHATTVYVGKDSYAYSYGSDSSSSTTPSPTRMNTRQMRELERDLDRLKTTMPHSPGLEHDLDRLKWTMPRIASIPRMPRLPVAAGAAPRAWSIGGRPGEDEKLDPDTQLKLDALYAIGDTKEDEKSFKALKAVALDVHANERLRTAALDIVSEFEKYDVLSIYTEIARQDTSEVMQSYAIDYITNNAKDKNKSVQTLIDLYNGTPKSRGEQKRRLFFAIAEVGNDRAVDFVASVAKTSDDHDMRREAVYYLGTMGSEKARTALYDILQGSQER
jgi:hypothetical protein